MINKKILQALLPVIKKESLYKNYILVNFKKGKPVEYTATDGHIVFIVKDNINAEFDLNISIGSRFVEIIIKHGICRFPYIIDCAFDEKQKLLKVFTKIDDYTLNFVEKDKEYKDKIDALFEKIIEYGKSKIEILGLNSNNVETLVKVCKILKIDYFNLNLKGTHKMSQELIFPGKNSYFAEIKGAIMLTTLSKSEER